MRKLNKLHLTILAATVFLLCSPMASVPALAQVSSTNSEKGNKDPLLKALSEPAQFYFECEPLRDVLKFVTTITGVEIRVDEKIYEQLGRNEDCWGNAFDRREIFVDLSMAKELPLEVTLDALLKQYGLGFSVEGDYLYISERHTMSEPLMYSMTPDILEKAREKMRGELRQPVAFEFGCEPLRDVLRFLTTIRGVNIFCDMSIFDQLGESEDCYRKPVDRKEIFVEIHVSGLPLEAALNAILRQYGLGFSFEPGYIYISAYDKLANPVPQTPEPKIQAAAETMISEALSEPISFEFNCESLRAVLRFMTTISHVNIIDDQNIYKRYGKYEDCYGNAVEQKDIFIGLHASEIPLEEALDKMLKPYGLEYSIEDGYVYVTFQEQKGSSGARVDSGGQISVENEAARYMPEWSSVDGDNVGWPEIKVKSIFDPTNSENYIAILEINYRRLFVKAGEHLNGFEIIGIDGESKCVTIAKHGPGDALEEREFCKEPPMVGVGEVETEWPQIEVRSIFDPNGSKDHVAVLTGIDDTGKFRFVRAGEQLMKGFEVIGIDAEGGCVTIAGHEKHDKVEERKFCIEPVAPAEGEWPEIEVKNIFDPTLGAGAVAILNIDGNRRYVTIGDRFMKGYAVVWIDGDSNCVTIARHGPVVEVEERKFCREE